MKVILDKYEQEIEDSLSKGEFISASDLDETKQLFEEAVKNYKELQETKSITLRIKRADLVKIKANAIKNGIGYQTLIGLLIRQYIKRETEIRLD